MKTNKEHLVEMSLQARIHAPTWKKEYKIDQGGSHACSRVLAVSFITTGSATAA